MASQPVNFSAGLPETVLPEESSDVRVAIDAALASDDPVNAVESVVAQWPGSLGAWAALGDIAPTTMQRYAAYRVGYHRGLDALRANGWRGSGYVRAAQGGNDAFLRCLRGLGEAAAAIGEHDEAERVGTFLLQLDPSTAGSAAAGS